jgi:caa(3)-type oxidase subunit IV
MSETHHTNYVKIWGILCVLLVVSLVGPELGIRVVTLLTAFGIAIVKAYLVVKYFMHVNVQPGYVAMLLTTALAFMLLMFAGIAPDVMKAEGTNWTKPSYAYHDTAGPHASDAHGEEH